jgi:hypothetical protein
MGGILHCPVVIVQLPQKDPLYGDQSFLSPNCGLDLYKVFVEVDSTFLEVLEKVT